MTPDEAAQRQDDAVAAPAPLYIHACPGAGKTGVVVSRFIRGAIDQGRRLAVVSFTNRASDEVSHRCLALGRPELTHFPNFVGTFDRFIATFIVRPFGQLGGPIRIVDSWDSLEVRIAATGVTGTISLDHFEFSADGVLTFDKQPGDPAAVGAALSRLEWAANQRYKELTDQGYITCDDARRYALGLLAEHPQIAELLRERFTELIVDEAQDCSANELAILGQLREAGLPVVVVCDPNQSIYEWRDADPATFAAFVEDLDQIRLEGNWRSTPAICAIAGTLREGPADTAVGDHADDQQPISVVRYTGWVTPALGEHFATAIDGAGIDPVDALILGHRASSAARAAGAGNPEGTSRLATLAIASMRLVDPALDPRERQHELDRIQRLLLRFIGIEPAGVTIEHACEAGGIPATWLAGTAMRLATAIGPIDPNTMISEWVPVARGELATIGQSAPRGTAAPGTFLPTPPNSGGTSVRDHIKGQIGTTGIRYSTIHRAKGTQARAVMTVIPRDRAPLTRSADLLDAWESDEPSEAKRVLYVALTRAEELCVLAIPDGLADRLIGLLEGHGVPHQMSVV